MERVRTALGHHLDTRGTVAVGGVHEVGLNLELIKRIERECDGGVVDVGDGEVDSIERGALVAVLRTPPISADRLVHHRRAAAHFHRAGGEGDEIVEVARVERQPDHGAIVDDGAYGGGVGLQPARWIDGHGLGDYALTR